MSVRIQPPTPHYHGVLPTGRYLRCNLVRASRSVAALWFGKLGVRVIVDTPPLPLFLFPDPTELRATRHAASALNKNKTILCHYYHLFC